MFSNNYVIQYYFTALLIAKKCFAECFSATDNELSLK